MESLCIYRLVNKIDELLPSKSTTLLFDLLSSNLLFSCSSSLSPTLVYKLRATSSVSFSTKCLYNEPQPGSQQGARPKPLSPQTYLTRRKVGQKNYIGCLSPVELDLTNISISRFPQLGATLTGKSCAVAPSGNAIDLVISMLRNFSIFHLQKPSLTILHQS
jgi:hypothetical protein